MKEGGEDGEGISFFQGQRERVPEDNRKDEGI